MRRQSNRRLVRMIALGAAAMLGATLSGCVGTYAWSDGHSYGRVHVPVFWWGHHWVSSSHHGSRHGGGNRGGGHGGRGHR